MFDFLFRFLERSENQRKAAVSFALSLFLIANIATWLFAKAAGSYRIIHFDQIDEIFRFILGGGLLIVLIFFFVVWVVLHNLAEFLISIYYPVLAKKIWKFFGSRISDLQTPNKRFVPHMRSFLETYGLLTVRDQVLQPGVFVILYAKNLKKAFQDKPTTGEPRIPTSSALVIQFLIAYWLVAKPLCPLPLIVDIGFYIFALFLVALDLFVNSLFFMIILHKDEIIALAPPDNP